MNLLIQLFHRVATGPKLLRQILTPLGGLFYFTSFISLAYLTFKLDRKLHLKVTRLPILRWLLGLPLLGTGICLVVWTVRLFLRAHGTPVPFNPPPEIVADGPYAFIRNPMISGHILISGGLALLIGAPLLLFVYTPFYIVMNVLFIKRIEEPELLARFGQTYEQYCARVPRFIP